jgi:hemerythrin
MSVITWSDTFKTGHPTVDAQHQKLFQMVNDLHEAIVSGKGKEFQGKVLLQLGAYTLEHFKTEEALMTSLQYPGMAAHKAKHTALAQQATDLIARHKAGTLVLAMTVSRFLAEWIEHHIQEEDKALIQWLRQRKP